MDYDTDKIDQTVLALLTLTLHEVDEFGGRSWKGHDWAVLNRLHEKGLISDPVSKAKSELRVSHQLGLDPESLKVCGAKTAGGCGPSKQTPRDMAFQFGRVGIG